MTAGKKKPEEKNPETSDIKRTLRDDAEKQITYSPESYPTFKGQTPEQIIHELQVHQIELEIQAEELRKSKLALEESRDKFLDLYDFAPIGLLTVNEKGSIIEVNLTCSTLLGVWRSELVRARFSKFVVPEDQDQWYWYITNLLRQEEKQCCTLRLKSAGGSAFPARLEGVRLGSGEIHNEARIVFSDITDMKKAEETLIQANKKLNLLSSINRHDINNQLTGLRGYLAILEKKQTDPTLNEYCSKASNAAQRIASMIQFTKEYEKIGVNAPIWQDCRTLVDTAVKQAPLGKIIVKNDLPAGTEVFADPLAVKVFYNLMDNAVRYGGKITTIRFSDEEREGNHLILCEDDGDGVVAAEKEKIFERGFGKNTGLGLALSREILSITGITIRETGVPGKGARFEITVPKGAWRMAGKEN